MPSKTNRRANQPPTYKFTDENTKRKIRRHLKDPNDVITDKDIKDAKVPGAETGSSPLKQGNLDATKEKNDNPIDDIPGNPATPWDILKE